MKKIIPFIVIISILSFFLPSCNGNDSNPETNYYMKAKINDTIDFKSEGYLAQSIFLQVENTISFTGMTSDNRSIAILIDTSDYSGGVATYNEQKVTFMFSIDQNSGGVAYSSILDGQGTLTITEEDGNHVKGTFNFTANLVGGNPQDYNLGQTVTITNGTFNSKKINY